MAITINFTWEDEKGATSTNEMHLPDDTSVGDQDEMAQDMAVLMKALSGAGLVGITATRNISFAGFSVLAVSPTVGSDVEETAQFVFGTEGGFSTKISIPAFIETNIQAGSKLVNRAATNVAPFIAAMILGLTQSENLVQPVDSRGDDIIRIKSAKENFRRSRTLRI